MPSNVAMERPKSRVVGNKTDEDPAEARESEGISARGVRERDIGDTWLVEPITLAQDPKDVTVKMEPMSSHQCQLAESNSTVAYG